MNRVIVGFFLVPGFGPDSVEVPCTGNGPADYAALDTEIRKKHGRVQPSTITRTGSIIEIRDGENAFVDLHEGATLGQLFSDEKEGEGARVIGHTFFSGAPFEIVLLHLRSSGQIAIELRGRVRTDGVIRMPGRISPQRLASELPIIVREVLGQDAHDIKLKLRHVDMKERV